MKLWLAFVLGAGLCWGTYVPMIAYGGKELKSRYAAFLCVGLAYFALAVLFPVGRFLLTGEKAAWNGTGITFATLAGAAGALGALCVIFAAASAGPADRLYIAPLIFGLAPVINTLVSLFWHPRAGSAWHFALPERAPGWTLYVGIVLTGLGAALVLYSKEAAEAKPQPPASTVAPNPPGRT